MLYRHRWTPIYTDKKCKFDESLYPCILNDLCKSVSICGDKAFAFRCVAWRNFELFYEGLLKPIVVCSP